MEELEPYAKELRMSRLQKLRMSHNDLRRESWDVRVVYYSVACMAALAITAIIATGVQELTHKPTFQEQLEDTADDFEYCLEQHTNPEQRAELDISFAFPDYELSPDIQVTVSQCRAENPMPQPTN